MLFEIVNVLLILGFVSLILATILALRPKSKSVDDGYPENEATPVHVEPEDLVGNLLKATNQAYPKSVNSSVAKSREAQKGSNRSRNTVNKSQVNHYHNSDYNHSSLMDTDLVYDQTVSEVKHGLGITDDMLNRDGVYGGVADVLRHLGDNISNLVADASKNIVEAPVKTMEFSAGVVESSYDAVKSAADNSYSFARETVSNAYDSVRDTTSNWSSGHSSSDNSSYSSSDNSYSNSDSGSSYSSSDSGSYSSSDW